MEVGPPAEAPAGMARRPAHRSSDLAKASCWPVAIAQGLGHVAHRRAGPVGDDVGHLRGVQPPVPGVDVLDDLFAPTALDVDVDVGRTVAFGREEPLEQQAERHRVGLGDADGEAHRRVGRRAAALAEDVGPPAELDQVPHDQEVAGEPQLLDDVELVVDLVPGRRGRPLTPGAVPPGGATLGDGSQPRHLGVALGHREVGQLGRHE